MPPPSSQSSNLEWALRYSGNGVPVFPVWPIRDGKCSCPDTTSCKSPGKHPLTRTGFKAATADEEQIERWWAETPDANIGMPTGAVSGYDVLDFDPRNYPDGKDAFEELRKAGEIDLTLMVQTGGGGFHVYLAYHGGNKGLKSGAVIPGLDFKTDGGYVLLPPSNHL